MSESPMDKSNVAASPAPRLFPPIGPESPVGDPSVPDRLGRNTTFPHRVHIRQTSLLSYIELKKEDLGKRQLQVYEFISAYPKCSDREIVKGTRMEINCVCGRRNELVKLGYVVDAGVKHDEITNRLVTIWSVV